ncbi:hypothetical protein [Paenibacillus sp. MMO-58]|uniref:hypothetical protein n=1 Tax=Paenibacillus sp. MMO-58 TaxID=3081290 RepID=UPI0030175B2B
MENSYFGLINNRLEGLLEEKKKETERGKGTEIGVVSPELLAKCKEHMRKEQALEDEMAIEHHRLELALKRRMKEMFEDRTDHLDNEKEKLWRVVEGQFGLSENADLSVDPKTGVVTHYIKEEPVQFKFDGLRGDKRG